MKQYYDFVYFLDSYSDKDLDNTFKDSCKSINIHLEGDRYYRFCYQIVNFINIKYEGYRKKLFSNLSMYEFDSSNIEMDVTKLKSMTNVINDSLLFDFIKDEDKKEIKKVIVQDNNGIIDELKELYPDDDSYQVMIEQYRVGE